MNIFQFCFGTYCAIVVIVYRLIESHVGLVSRVFWLIFKNVIKIPFSIYSTTKEIKSYIFFSSNSTIPGDFTDFRY